MLSKPSYCQFPSPSCVCVCTIALRNPDIEWIVGMLFYFNNMEFARIFLKTILLYVPFRYFSFALLFTPLSFTFYVQKLCQKKKNDGVIKERNTQMHNDLSTFPSSSLCQAPFVWQKGGCYRQIMDLEAWDSEFKSTSTCTFPDWSWMNCSTFLGASVPSFKQ